MLQIIQANLGHILPHESVTFDFVRKKWCFNAYCWADINSSCSHKIINYDGQLTEKIGYSVFDHANVNSIFSSQRHLTLTCKSIGTQNPTSGDFMGFPWFVLTTQKERKVKSRSRVQLFETPWTAAYQAPPSIGFSRQEYWSGSLFPSPGDLPNPGIKPRSPTL